MPKHDLAKALGELPIGWAWAKGHEQKKDKAVNKLANIGVKCMAAMMGTPRWWRVYATGKGTQLPCPWVFGVDAEEAINHVEGARGDEGPYA